MTYGIPRQLHESLTVSCTAHRELHMQFVVRQQLEAFMLTYAVGSATAAASGTPDLPVSPRRLSCKLTVHVYSCTGFMAPF